MMNNLDSFKAYGKVNEADQHKLEARRKTRKRITIITLSSIVLVCVVVAAVVGTTQVHNNSGGEAPGQTNPLSTSMKAVCDVTLYKDSCYHSLGPVLGNSSQITPEYLLKMSIQVALSELSKVISEHFYGNGSSLYGDAAGDNMSTEALANCRDLLELAMDHLNSALSMSAENAFDDFKTWLSAAVTYHETCIDGFMNATTADSVLNYLKSSTESTSNSLAIINWLSNVVSSFKLRRLMSTNDDHPGEMPKWLTSKNRKLLQVADLKKKANIVVAKDGSGKYKTISDALNAVPEKSDKRFVIYVKKGVYWENVRVEKPKWNVMMIGDGMDATVVSSSLNFIDGTPTFSSATFAVFGKGFVARDMGFRNTAGAIKHQAVAMMSTSDQSVFYRCRFDAYQDTLYTHSNRQFYRECNIHGTVDFIFGNSAVVFQNCNILPKTPMPGQQNTITAQGKVDPNQNTGIVIQNCTLWAGGNLTNVKTYLGRPWKIYSTTIYMNSMMGSLIDPTGWLPWNGTSAPDTIFYSEYQNFGPGSSTKYRVKWKGLRNISSTKEASKFTVKSFIMGDKWISDAGVSFKSGL